MSLPISLNTVDQQVTDLVSGVNLEEWTRQYWEHGEFFSVRNV